MRQKTENNIKVNPKVSLKNTQVNKLPSNLILKKKKQGQKAKNIRNEKVVTSTDPMLYTFMAVNFIIQRKIGNFQKKIDYQQQKNT